MTHQVVLTLCLWTSYDTSPLEDCQNKKLQIISIINIILDGQENRTKIKTSLSVTMERETSIDL